MIAAVWVVCDSRCLASREVSHLRLLSVNEIPALWRVLFRGPDFGRCALSSPIERYCVASSSEGLRSRESFSTRPLRLRNPHARWCRSGPSTNHPLIKRRKRPPYSSRALKLEEETHLTMSAPVEARVDLRNYQECMSKARSKAAKEKCAPHLNSGISKVGDIAQRDCAPQAEDFFQCFNHQFQLPNCGDDVTRKLVQCQENTVRNLASFR